MNELHTQGPLSVKGPDGRFHRTPWYADREDDSPTGMRTTSYIPLVDQTGTTMALVVMSSDLPMLTPDQEVEHDALAERLAACWNFCQGTTTPELVPKTFDKMLDELEANLQRIESSTQAIAAQRDALLNVALRLNSRGFFTPVSCADLSTVGDMTDMTETINMVQGLRSLEPQPTQALLAAAEIEALGDMLEDARAELALLRLALNVPYEPHQTLMERTLEAAQAKQPPVAPDGFTAGDMASASAQGFRDGEAFAFGPADMADQGATQFRAGVEAAETSTGGAA